MSEGIGWPRTYFVWGFVSGALFEGGLLGIVTGRPGIGVFTVLLSSVAYLMAKNMKRPLFGSHGQ